MKLYIAKTPAVNPLRVQTLLNYKNINIDIHALDLQAGEHKQADFTNINPFSQVPVLQKDDGTFLFETEIICRYLENLYPDRNLCGVGFDESLQIEMTERQIVNNFTQPLIQFFKHNHPAMAGRVQQITAWAALCNQTVTHNVKWLENQLQDKEFFVNHRLTMTDITLYLTIGMADRIGFTGFSASPVVQNYYQSIGKILQK